MADAQDLKSWAWQRACGFESHPGHIFLAFGLLAFVILSLGSARQESATYDEPLHIASGYASWAYGDYQTDPSNPPLIGYWLSLPLLVQPWRLPDNNPQAFANNPRSIFLNYNRRSSDLVLNLPRMMNIVLGMALMILLFIWAREALGPPQAAATVIAFSFCPTLLAHGHLATADMGFALFATLLLYQLWRWRNQPSAARVGWTGVALGLVLCTKYFSLSLIPIALGVIAADVRVRSRKSLRMPTLKGAALFLLGLWGVMAVCYHGPGLPQWWVGFQDVRSEYAGGHGNFLFGHYNDRGWWFYFAAAFLLKTPLPFLILTGAGVWLWAAGRLAHSRFVLVWFLLPALLFLTVASISPIQVGIRHVLWVYPLMCGWVGNAAVSLWQKSFRFSRLLVSLLAVWYVGSTAYFFPRYISYFNEAAGGPSGGYRYLLDSNLDWGQGLKALGHYVQREHAGQIYLSYFGCDDPHNYGIRYTPIAPVTCRELPGDGLLNPVQSGPVLFAISATNRGGVYYTPHSAFGWLKARRPAAVLLDSIWVYDITQDAEALGRLRLLSGVSKKG